MSTSLLLRLCIRRVRLVTRLCWRTQHGLGTAVWQTLLLAVTDRDVEHAGASSGSLQSIWGYSIQNIPTTSGACHILFLLELTRVLLHCLKLVTTLSEVEESNIED